jgi:D-alanine-D-alanine ligase
MRIGIAVTLKPDGPTPAGTPDDAHEEFDSPATVNAIAEVFRSLGHEAYTIGDGRPFLDSMLREPPDFVFNFAEGSGVSRSREARVPAVCEMLGVPYSGSDPLALAVSLDKDMTRRLAESAGVTIPKGITLSFPSEPYDGDGAEFPAMVEAAGLAFPLIAKPVSEGSSKGIRNRCVIKSAAEFAPTVLGLWTDYHQAVLIEEYISGDEVTVGIVGNDPPQPLGIMRMIPKKPREHFVYSLEVKRNWHDEVEYEAPAKLAPEVTREVEADALAVFTALGCRDVARADFRIRDGVPYFLEINPLPGLSPDSGDLCYLAYRVGLTHAELVGRILEAALTRCGLA